MINHEINWDILAHFWERIEEKAEQFNTLDVDLRVSLSVDECRKYHDNLGKFIYFDGLCDIFLVIGEFSDILYFIDYVLSAWGVLSFFSNVGS